MPQFRNMSDLRKYLQKAVDSALTHEVYEAVKQKEQEVIQEEVYDILTNHQGWHNHRSN